MNDSFAALTIKELLEDYPSIQEFFFEYNHFFDSKRPLYRKIIDASKEERKELKDYIEEKKEEYWSERFHDGLLGDDWSDKFDYLDDWSEADVLIDLIESLERGEPINIIIKNYLS